MCGLLKNRGWRDIIAKMLESAIEGNSKTKIMKQVRLSYYQLNEYIDMSIEFDLLMFKKNTKKYVTTKKGIEFLRLYDLINNLTKHETTDEKYV